MKCGAIGLTLGLVALMLILILTAVHAVGTDSELYYRLQMKAGILPEAGIGDDELRRLDRRMAAYLGGDAAALEDEPPFNEREMAHMADCFRLFALLRKVRSRLAPWAVLLIAGGAWLLQDRDTHTAGGGSSFAHNVALRGRDPDGRIHHIVCRHPELSARSGAGEQGRRSDRSPQADDRGEVQGPEPDVHQTRRGPQLHHSRGGARACDGGVPAVAGRREAARQGMVGQSRRGEEVYD